ncbi:hypothetical protein [Sphaerisporangium sp. NPDC051011]|uniref:hypothetical protein n=1 Tax=Sphaerisporangium sp. NPDC051011 TaxID=3155792 RepID=UPI0033D6826B
MVKPRKCALASVPLYLVIDTLQGCARLMSRPSPSGYAEQMPVTLGECLMLPDPWDLKIDTGKLLA